MLSNGERKYLIAREYLNGEERLLIKDADSDVEIKIHTSAGEFFFSRSIEEFMHGSEGAPVDISDILKTARVDIHQTTKVTASEILMLRDKLDSLGKKQMRLSAESMAARGVNPAERLRRARNVQKELLETDREYKELSDSENSSSVIKKSVFFTVLGIGGAVFVAGVLLLMLMQYISMSKSTLFFISLFLMGIGGAVLLWAGIFKFTEYILFRNMPNREELLRQRRDDLVEKLDILLDGADFEELEKQASSGEYSTSRSVTEIERELASVRDEMEATRKLLNELGCEGKPIISVMNKCDLVGDIYAMPTFGKTVMISAKEQKGFDELLDAVLKELPPTRRKAELLIPFAAGAMAARIRNEGVVEEEEYRPEGLYMRAIVEMTLLDTIRDYIIEQE